MSSILDLYHRLPLVKEFDRLVDQTGEVKETIRRELQSIRSILCLEVYDRLRDEKCAREGPLSLHRFEHQVCSQHGEDGVLVEIFRRIGDGKRSFVEVGVGDGIENNTAFLNSLGWSGAWIDARPITYPLPPEVHFCQSFVTRENIAALFTDLAVPRDVDLCSLDIDQNTYFIWDALTAWRPRVVVIEYNASLPPSVNWKVSYDGARIWDGSINFGASLKAFELLGMSLGYSLVHCEISGANAFFIRNDLVGERFVGPFDAETQYEPPRYSLDQTQGHCRARLDRLTAR